ncbi:diguanylate cyclase [Pelobium manganitolerans]|uniref:Diguanylate cyclase n=1 Tax=Pelobium manganitolerans TaxID=1842495 RepID=A0A419S3S5_9SPHI|nr:GAF domain-containing protein [Pelobium manganitolerans]RKD14288.1 diguanylate cyclase [Pelobium manganitolerans]
MAEDLAIRKGNKSEQYRSIVPQIKSLLSGETDLVANLGNICAALKEQFGWFWVGFYLVKNDELVLSAFQGPVACTRIQKGKGVCGQAWEQEQTLIVENVNQFDGHIACSSKSQSEIVVPILRNGKFIGVLDVDSEHLAHFDEVDQLHLEQLLSLVDFSSL